MESAVDRLVAYIRTRRSQLGISQNELARLSGLNPGTLANIMVGRVTKAPSLDTLQKLAIGMQMDSDDLFRIARGETPLQADSTRPGARDGTARPTVARPRGGKHPLTDREWDVLVDARRAGLYVDQDRVRSLLGVTPANREGLFAELESLARKLSLHQSPRSNGT